MAATVGLTIKQIICVTLLYHVPSCTARVGSRDNLDALMVQYGQPNRPVGPWKAEASPRKHVNSGKHVPLPLLDKPSSRTINKHHRSGGHFETQDDETEDIGISHSNMETTTDAATTVTYMPTTETASPTTEKTKNVTCNNDGLPLCNLTSHVIYHDYPYMFEVPGQGLVDRIVSIFQITHFRGACVIDPFLGVQIDPQTTVPISVEIEIDCYSPDTRVAFQPSVNLSDTVAFAFLVPINCSLYWNDLSIFGQHINFLVWEPLGWQDEFIDGQPEYFYDCVHDIGNNTNHFEEIRPPILGLQNLTSFILHNGVRPQTPSPVFTKYMWPNLAEVVFSGYLSSESDVSTLRYTMPNLQSIELIGGSSVMKGIMVFPWTNHTSTLPLNLSRTIDGNDQYAMSVGLDHLAPNIFRRVLILDSYHLQDLFFLEMKGGLDKIQIIRCKLPMLDPYVFQEVSDRQALDLSENRLTSLPSGLLDNMPNLVTLRIDNNRLNELSNTTFRGVSNLKTLSLVGNNLTHIDDGVFAGLPLLTTLDLTNNHLVHISDDALGPLFSDYLKLTKVSFSKNFLTDFPIWLLSVRFLSTIDLSHNELRFSGIVKTLQRIESPGYIEINNGFSTSTTGYKYKPAIIKTIDMKYNLITAMDLSLLDNTTFLFVRLLLNFFQLDLTTNNLTCDCHMYSLFKYLRSKDTGADRNYMEIGVLPYNLDNIRCQSPSSVSGEPVVDVNIDTFGCSAEVPDCPAPCQCWVRSVDQAVFVYCNKTHLESLPETMPQESVELDYSGNSLKKLYYPLPRYISSLQRIDMSGNQLSGIDPGVIGELCHNCTLNLHHNALTHLPKQVTNLPLGVELTLSNNFFVCDCHTLWMKQWLISMRHQVTDIDGVLCSSGKPQGKGFIDALDKDFVCELTSDEVKILASAGTVSGILMLVLLLLIPSYKYRGEIKILLYMRFGWHFFDKTDDTDILEKHYDAFVSYSHADAHWVWQELLPFLENQEPYFRLCIHDRDFMAGAAVADNISAAVNISRRTIIVLSQSFLNSHWCFEEFRQAHYKVMRERTNYLIMVLCEDVSIEDVDEDMRLYLKTNTYLPRDSRWFWDKLRYAMPQTPLSVLLERRGCERRESECPLIDAVAQDLYVAEGAAAAPCCSYRGPVTDGSREPRAPTCCQHSGPTCGSSATKT